MRDMHIMSLIKRILTAKENVFKRQKETINMIWFTSDTHFGHENVLKFTDRPWETIWQRNVSIVFNFNG